MAATVYIQTSGRDAQQAGRVAYINGLQTDNVGLDSGVVATGKLMPGKLAKLIVTAVGTTWTLDIYDAMDTEGNINPMYRYVTAEGKVNISLDRPFARGIKIVSGGGGAAGEASLVYEL